MECIDVDIEISDGDLEDVGGSSGSQARFPPTQQHRAKQKKAKKEQVSKSPKKPANPVSVISSVGLFTPVVFDPTPEKIPTSIQFDQEDLQDNESAFA